ncbi:MAG: peptidase domain-containing ABC transporter [Bacteroidales bacterium]|nr:peptidase domain-containing ABC transporter [Bacteroidales bacterium]
MKLVLQHDAMQCGIACLSMVFNHYGKDYSIEFLEQYAQADAEGMSLLGLAQAAEKLGLHAVCGRSTLSALKSVPLPAVLHWRQNHYVVLDKISRGGKRFRVFDPGIGIVNYSREEFLDGWISTKNGGEEKGVVMLISPTQKFYENTTANTENNGEKRSFKFLLNYLKQYKKQSIFIFFALTIGSLIQLALPFFMQAVVDKGIKNQSVDLIWLILIGQLVLTFSATVIDFIRQRILLKISMEINISLISDFFIKLLKLPMKFFDVKQTGDILQRIHDHERVEYFLTGKTLNAFFSFLTFLIFSGVLFVYSIKIFTVFIIGSVLYGLWTVAFLNRRKVLDYITFSKQAEVNNRTYQFVTSVQEIKLQNCKLRRRKEWEQSEKEVFAVKAKTLKLQQLQEAGGVLVNQGKNIVMTVIAATSVISGDMTLGMMMAVQYILGQLNSPVEQITEFFYSVQDVKISLERINEIHEKTDENFSRPINEVSENCSGIEFKNVNFKYNIHRLKNTLTDINVLFERGKQTAIVGASGSGKTTLIKLMLGYYEATEGGIFIGDENLSDINLDLWRSKCGVVMQEGVIFSESIARNIAVGDGEIDVERLKQAAETACIFDYVMSLPLKFDTKIGADGIGLSQGQKQRILIARAVYKNPDYIFLDEATNALDAENERKIVENLSKFYQDKTVIVAAHRLSTVKNADKIIVLSNGKIAEVGTHESLSEKRGIYYNLVKNQLELGG